MAPYVTPYVFDDVAKKSLCFQYTGRGLGWRPLVRVSCAECWDIRIFSGVGAGQLRYDAPCSGGRRMYRRMYGEAVPYVANTNGGRNHGGQFRKT